MAGYADGAVHLEVERFEDRVDGSCHRLRHLVADADVHGQVEDRAAAGDANEHLRLIGAPREAHDRAVAEVGAGDEPEGADADDDAAFHAEDDSGDAE